MFLCIAVPFGMRRGKPELSMSSKVLIGCEYLITTNVDRKVALYPKIKTWDKNIHCRIAIFLARNPSLLIHLINFLLGIKMSATNKSEIKFILNFNSTGSSKINGAKLSDTCSVRANWLCMGWPFCLAEMRREFQTGGNYFCTTLYSFWKTVNKPFLQSSLSTCTQLPETPVPNRPRVWVHMRSPHGRGILSLSPFIPAGKEGRGEATGITRFLQRCARTLEWLNSMDVMLGQSFFTKLQFASFMVMTYFVHSVPCVQSLSQ